MKTLIAVLILCVLGCAAPRPSNYQLLSAYLKYEAAETTEAKQAVLEELTSDVLLQSVLGGIEPSPEALDLAQAAFIDDPDVDPAMIHFLARLLTALEEQP